MRDDPSKKATFLNSEVWGRQKYNQDFLVPPENFDFADDDPRNEKKFVSNSLSGNERNRMFMSTNENFADITLVSGADDLADARSFALTDFDNDGWVDIALMSLNTPRFKLYRNEFGKLFPENVALQIRLNGAHQSSEQTRQQSNRDGIGTKVLVTYESGKIAMFQKQAGEGFGSQNSAVLRIGCRPDDSIKELKIIWPSGTTQTVESPDVSKVLSIKEKSE